MKFSQLKESTNIPVIQQKLPYGYADLAPVLCERTVKWHYDVLTTGYFTRYNSGEGDKEFNRAGGLLHNIYWSQLRKPKAGNAPHGASLALIEKHHKSWDNFQDLIIQKGMSIQGSGWVYWSTSGEIKTISNHAWKTDIILCIDVWEHSFLMNPNADKKHYLSTIFRCMNWDVINDRISIAL